MRFAPFTIVQVRDILAASEGQPGPGGGAIGHAGARHVSITREGLFRRMATEGATNAGMPVYTAFLRFDDQVATVCTALNSAIAAPLLNAFYDPARPDGANLALENIVIENAVQVRVALGGNGPGTRMASFVTVYAKRMRRRPREMHIVTAFATFEKMTIGTLPPGF